MPMDPDGEILRLRTVLRDLVALSAIPAAWVGREPSAVAAGLADVLIGLLPLDFVFVRLCDPDGAGAVDVTRGSAWKAFREWLERDAGSGRQFSRRQVIPDVGGGVAPCRGVVIPIGVNAEGGLVAAASERADFPGEIDQLLLSVATNQAATAFQNARLIHERMRAEDALRHASNELETKVEERTAELRRSEAYLVEAQRLAHTGSYAWSVATGEYTHSSDEHLRLFGFDPAQGVPPFEAFQQRRHPDDRKKVLETLASAIANKTDFEIDGRVVLPDGTTRYLHGVGHPVFDASGGIVEYVGTSMDVTDRKLAEQERQDHLWFFESMDRVNRAMHGTNDLEQMMGDVLEAALQTFACDRAWLVYPCDPEVAFHRVRMERTRPEYVGAFGRGIEIPNDPEVSRLFRSVLDSSGPVRFDPESGHAVPSAPAERFSITSMMAMAVYPKVDRPYMLGLHHCAGPRVWTPKEERLFAAIGRRLADALDALLMFRNLRESERRLEEAQRITHVGYWDRDVDADRITWSGEVYRIFGMPPQQGTITLAEVQERLHPDDRQIMAQAVSEALRGRSRYDVEYRVVRPNGEVRIIHSQGNVTKDESGRPYRMFGTVQDITERKQSEQLLEDLAGRLINAQEAERSRIGRELHDHVSQVLALLTIKIDQLRTDPAVAPGMAGALDALRAIASEIADDVHRLSYRLHSSTLDYQGLVPALAKLVAEFSSRHGISIDFAHASLPAALPSDVALCLFRVTEESLTNIAKHSHAQSAHIRVNGTPDGLHLAVEDDGSGFDVRGLTNKAGLGFVSMQERLRALRGTFRVDSVPSRGTRIDVWVPSASLLSSVSD
jgi:PAS domain S-box-containing protein